MSNLILIGFMGSGKTTVGIQLSYRLRMTMVDTDKIIEREQNCTIREIFERDGEETFRKLETGCLKSLLKNSKDQIISVGGGLPMREENHSLLKKLGTVIYLRVTKETVYERLKNDSTRPLLQGEEPMSKIEELLKVRAPIYEKASQLHVDVDGKTFDEIVDEIEILIGYDEREWASV